MKYVHKKLTWKQADKILKTWGHDGEDCYCENDYGAAYYNGKTGEILWYAEEESDTNAELLKE
jgi:hypothetical protein